MKAWKLIHATKGQERVAERANKPSGHGKRMYNKQAMDTHGSGARIRLRHHLLVPNQYRSGGPWVRGKKRYGLAVGRKGKAYYGVLALALLGEMSCWDDIPPKREKDELKSLGTCYRG